MVAGLVIGTLVGLGGWWLVRERFDESLKALAILIGGGALVAGFLRVSRLWRSAAVGGAALFVQLVLALAVIYRVALPSGARHEFWSVVLALSMPIVVWAATELTLRAIALVLRMFGTGREVARARASAASPFLVVPFLAGAGFGIWEFLSGHGHDDLRAVLVAWVGLVAIPVLLLSVDLSRRKLPRAYKRVSFAGIIALIAALSTVAWTRTGLVAFAVLLALLTIGSLTAHLTYLWAWALLAPGGDRSGDLGDEAGRALAWVDDRANPKPSTNAARAARMVYPSTTGPSGPLQALVAQIFDVGLPADAQELPRALDGRSEADDQVLRGDRRRDRPGGLRPTDRHDRLPPGVVLVVSAAVSAFRNRYSTAGPALAAWLLAVT